MPGPAPPPEAIKPSFTARLYERLGPRYIAVPAAVILLVALVDVGVAAIGAVEYFPKVNFLPVALTAAGGCLVATVLSFLTGRSLMRPLWDWVRGDRTPEAAVRVWSDRTEKFPAAVLLGGLYFSLGVLPASLMVTAQTPFPWYGDALVIVWVEILVAAATVADYLGIEATLRPVLRDVARFLPPDHAYPEFGRRLGTKVFAAVAVLVSFTAALAAGAGSLVEGTSARLAVAIAVAFGMTATLGVVLGSVLARSVASPVAQLLKATGEVARGNLDTRVPVAAWDEMGSLAKAFNTMVRGLREREALRSAMGAYVHPDIARRVLEEGELLEGIEADASVLVLDVRGFTALSDQMAATEAVAFLNQLFSSVVPIVDARGGHVNKFLGDGLLAVFGVPERLEDHADRAVAAAREIVRQVRDDYRGAVRIGIGINSGPVVAGTIGGGAHLEYGLIGDTVNVAARIEQLTKDVSDSILISEATRSRCSSVVTEPRGAVTLRGKREEIAVHAVPDSDLPDSVAQS